MDNLGVTAELQVESVVMVECGASEVCTEWLLSTLSSVPATSRCKTAKPLPPASTYGVVGGHRDTQSNSIISSKMCSQHIDIPRARGRRAPGRQGSVRWCQDTSSGLRAGGRRGPTSLSDCPWVLATWLCHRHLQDKELWGRFRWAWR